MSVLQIESLQVRYPRKSGEDIVAVRDFSLSVGGGECVGVVGESGAGKSQAFLAAMGLLESGAQVSGSVRFKGTELLGARATDLDSVRGAALTMIFQDPLTSLTPHLTIGVQLMEPMQVHAGITASLARERALDLLRSVQINDAERRLSQYPHELSGGMRQRVMIAMALACAPALVIADEPTTALDVTIQAQILKLLARLKSERSMSLVLITHDLGVVAGVADRIVVMQGGRIVEQGATRSLLKSPEHSHTRALLASASRIDRDRLVLAAGSTKPTIEVADLHVHFNSRGAGWKRVRLHALNGVGLQVAEGEALGIVGESGCGKSTLARAALRLIEPDAGRIVWFGRDVVPLMASKLRPLRRDLQIVFQDPLASLDPRMTIEQIISEPLSVHQPGSGTSARREAVVEAMGQVALPAEMLHRYPHQLSGGQCQRIAIARAMILRPKVLVCDEAVSALDVTTQGQIVALIESLCEKHGLTLLFISHDLAVVRRLCHRVLVLYLGRMMELACAAELYARPAHPYTKALLDAVPIPDPDLQPARLARALAGDLPSPLSPPFGCVFHTRCAHAIDVCRREVPRWENAGEHRQVACHRWREWPQQPSVDSP